MPLNEQARLKVWEPFRDKRCTACPLHKEAQSVCLMGDGPVPADLMIVGEAPGYREDEIARPFSGTAGKFLDRKLAQAGINRDMAFVTNSAKCRPPDNRTPTRTELKACRHFLESELAVVRPRWVLLLGNTALQQVLGVTGITKRRGSVEEKGGVNYFSTYHPAAILRNPAFETDFDADLLKLRRLMEGQHEAPVTKTYVVRNERSLAKLLDRFALVDSAVAFDVETRSSEPRNEGGFQHWAPDAIIDVLGLCWEPGTSYVIALDHPEANWTIPVDRVYEALDVAFAGKKFVAHNGKFDLEWLRTKGVTSIRVAFDTFLAAHLLDENRSNSLKSLARTYLGAENYEADVQFVYAESLNKLATYNGRDVDYTLRLYQNVLRPEMLKASNKGVRRIFKYVSMPAVHTFADVERNGFPVDMERLKTRHKEILQKIEDIQEEMMQWVPSTLSTGGRPNFRSPLFLAEWLFGALKLPVIEVGAKSGRPSTREAVLLQLKRKHPALEKLMELRKWMKYESTYTRNWLERVSVAGRPRLYTSYNLGGTVTGRLSSNMQQVPRDTYIRGIIGARSGWKLIEADFSQVELRLAAVFANDTTLIKIFKDGRDPHMETAIDILRKPREEISKEERKLAKSINFGFLYGMRERKFIDYCFEKYDIKVSYEEAVAYRDAFFRKYPSLLSWHDRTRRRVQNLGYVSSPLGRVRHLPSVRSADEASVAEAERQAINSPVQGMASDLAVLSMVLLHEKLDRHHARVLGNLHDAVILEVRTDRAEQVAQTVRSTMENLPLNRLFGFRSPVPIKVDVAVVDHWGGV